VFNPPAVVGVAPFVAIACWAAASAAACFAAAMRPVMIS